jgi:hypothetical protein
MKWEEVIIGAVAILWGVILLVMRREMLELSREGGKGLRNRKVINILVITAVIFLFAAGITVIIVGGL